MLSLLSWFGSLYQMTNLWSPCEMTPVILIQRHLIGQGLSKATVSGLQKSSNEWSALAMHAPALSLKRKGRRIWVSLVWKWELSAVSMGGMGLGCSSWPAVLFHGGPVIHVVFAACAGFRNQAARDRAPVWRRNCNAATWGSTSLSFLGSPSTNVAKKVASVLHICHNYFRETRSSLNSKWIWKAY